MSAIPRPFTILGGGSSATGVTSSAVIADNSLVRGDGGARGIQGSVLSVADTTGTISGFGTGGGLTFHGGGTITGASGALTLTASGTNQNITLTPSGSGMVVVPSTNNLGGGANDYINFNTGAWAFVVGGTQIVDLATNTMTLRRNALGTTSADGVIVQNFTDAAAGFQQIGPRIGSWGEGWKTDATAASVVVGMGFETLPVEGAAAPTATMRFFSKIGAGAVTYPMTLTSAGVLTTLGGINTSADAGTGGAVTIPAGATYTWLNRARLHSSADAKVRISDTTSATGITLDASTDGTLKVRNFADSADAAITAGAATFSGLALTVATAAGSAGLRLPHGTAPTSPVDGDIWTTTAGLYVRINGATVGPLS